MNARMVATALFTYYVVVNVLTTVLFVVDKRRAQHGRWRVSEKALLGLSLAGGAVGGLVAMRTVRHKTRKPAFRYGLPAMVVLHVALAMCLAYAGARATVFPADAANGTTASDGVDAGVPPLDDGYAYVRARVIARDTDRKTVTVEVEPWEGSDVGVNVSSLTPGTSGEVDCSDLLTLAGVKEGATWVFSYYDEGQTSLPVAAFSIESPEHFAERA